MKVSTHVLSTHVYIDKTEVRQRIKIVVTDRFGGEVGRLEAEDGEPEDNILYRGFVAFFSVGDLINKVAKSSECETTFTSEQIQYSDVEVWEAI